MKFLIPLLFAVLSLGANASTLLVTFGTSGGVSNTTYSGTYDGAAAIYHVLNSGANYGATYSGLAGSDGSLYTVTTNAPVSGAGGRSSTINGDTSTLFSMFDQGAITGSSNAGMINEQGGSGFTVAGLTAGNTYSLTLYLGRGNNYGTAGQLTTYAMTAGATDVSYNILSSYQANITGVDAGSFSALTHSDGNTGTADHWVLATFSFTATGDSISFNGTGNTGNIGAFALTNTTIPEPATVSLGALAFVSLMMRRRR